jgi:hypothetical protein
VGIELSHRGAQPERHRRRRCLKKAQADASRRLRAFSVGEEDLQRAVLANLVSTGLGPQAALSGVQPPTERHAFTTTLAHPADRSTARHWPWGRRRYQVLVSDLAASGPRASTSDSNPMIPQRASTATRIVLICCGPRRRLCRPFAERARNGSASAVRSWAGICSAACCKSQRISCAGVWCSLSRCDNSIPTWQLLCSTPFGVPQGVPPVCVGSGGNEGDR